MLKVMIQLLNQLAMEVMQLPGVNVRIGADKKVPFLPTIDESNMLDDR